MIAPMQTPSEQKKGVITIPIVSPSPVEQSRDESVAPRDPLQAMPPVLPPTQAPIVTAATGNGEGAKDTGPESVSSNPGEKEQIRGTDQPATPQVGPSSLTAAPLSPPEASGNAPAVPMDPPPAIPPPAMPAVETLLLTASAGGGEGAPGGGSETASIPAARPSPAEPSREEAAAPTNSLPATPPAFPATQAPPLVAATGNGEGVKETGPEAVSSKPGEKEQIRGTEQPATPRVETAALTLRLSKPATSESLRSRGENVSAEQSYRLGPEDVIKVDVWQEKGLTVEVTVRPDGGISLPLISYVQAAGLTATELADVIAQKLREYIKEPHVAVIVTQVNASKIYVVGNVLKPGHYPLRTEMTVLQALSHAGGFTAFASPRGIKIIRGIGTGQEIRKVNYYRMIEETGEGNFLLKPGDTIVVP
jgi:polysaccharide export outer membrane protein